MQYERTKLFLFNGPPGSGKDEAVRQLTKKHPDKFIHDKLAMPLKMALKGLFGLSDEEFEFYDNTQSAKNSPSERFLGKSMRECYIDLAEKFVKTSFSDKDKVFGSLLLERLRSNTELHNKIVLISDSGFEKEVFPLLSSGKFLISLIKIHREGKTYNNDSRGYIDLTAYGVPTYNIDNNGSLSDYLHQIETIILSRNSI